MTEFLRVSPNPSDADRHGFTRAGQALYWPERPAESNLNLFLHNGLFADAIRLLADILPKRVAVWWGCQCIWDALQADVPEEAEQTIAAIVRWVVEPTDANREAMRNVDIKALDTPWSCLAAGVLWTEGTLSLPELPVVPPPDVATPRAVAGAILLTAVFRDPLRYDERYRRFLDLGLHLLQGRNLWSEIAAAQSVEILS